MITGPALVEERATFRPATDANGRPVTAWYGYMQSRGHLPPLSTGVFDLGVPARASHAKVVADDLEAEWWEYDSIDEMADAVAGDIGFIVESGRSACNEALLALPRGDIWPLRLRQDKPTAKPPWKR